LTRLTNASSTTAVSLGFSISADGDLIVFSSQDAEVAGDVNGLGDVYVFDRSAGTTTRISLGIGGAESNGASQAPAISPDGRFVAFESTATNLVAGDTNNRADIYVYDRTAGTTRRVSINTNPALGGGLRPWLSGDGSLATFTSTAIDLVSNDTNGVSDVFVAP
jgi:Tol biopolymer transport system component